MVIAALLALAPPKILERAHAHNDYEHARPLLDALDHGFASVEVDLFLVNGKLLVGHSKKELKSSRTLESLYLRPLADRAKQHSGWIYPRYYRPFWVLVDLKGDGAAAYKAFKKALEAIPPFKSVRFVISGDRPIEDIVKDNGRWAGLDGRWKDLDKPIKTTVMPWVSEDWTNHFKWAGKGAMPALEQQKLAGMVDAAHAEGYKLRFWGAPDTEAIWKVQWQAGVDWINTDRLDAVRTWMLKAMK